MKKNHLKILFFLFYIIIILNNYCNNIQLDSSESIFKYLYRFLNTDFNLNQTILIINKYYFNINFIQPVLNYTNFISNNDSITVIKPKLILYFNSKLYIPFNSKVNYCDENESYNNLSVSILMEVNFSNIIFNKLEDNSYVLDYHFNDNLSNNSKIVFNNIKYYSFFPKDISLEEKKNILDIYINNIKLYLEEYPECDGLFLFHKIQEYMIRIKYFNSTGSYSFYFINQ